MFTPPRGTSVSLAVFLAAFLTGCGKELPPVPPPGPKQLRVITLDAPAAAVTRSFSGQVRAARRVDLSFNVPGRIVELNATEGAEVEKGALLARLDDRNYQSRLVEARAEFKKTDANFERAKKLLVGDYISRTEYDQIKAARQVAAARMAAVRKTLGDTRLVAPFSGMVAARLVENFTEVNAKQPVISLEQVDRLEIVIDIPEQFIARKRNKGDVKLVARFDAFPDREFPLTIKEHATEADPRTGAYRYVTVMDRPDGLNLLPGMTATVEASVAETASEGEAPFLVPLAAVFAHVTPDPLVWLVDAERRVHQRKVRLGRLSGRDQVEMVEGLKRGDRLVVEAVTRLREGDQIEPRTDGGEG